MTCVSASNHLSSLPSGTLHTQQFISTGQGMHLRHVGCLVFLSYVLFPQLKKEKLKKVGHRVIYLPKSVMPVS